MVPMSRTRKRLRGPAITLACLIVLTLISGQFTMAQGSVPQAQPIDNSQKDFADGQFRRVSLAADQTSISAAIGEVPDEAGVVQLAPSGILNTWSRVGFIEDQIAGDDSVSDAGITALGNRIFVIGGDPAGTTNATDRVYMSTVTPKTGQLSTWVGSSLPSTQVIYDSFTSTNIPECSEAASARNRPGVVSLVTNESTGAGFIYVVGGVVYFPSCSYASALSTPTVLRASVSDTGALSAWTSMTNALIPSPIEPIDDGTSNSTRPLGVDGAAVTIAHVQGADGVTHYYLYVIGGRSSYLIGDSAPFGGSPTDLEERALKSVYYTEINPTTGEFAYPGPGTGTSVWKRDSNIDLALTPGSREGLWNSAVTTVNRTVGAELKASIFLAGGMYDVTGTNVNSPDPYLYRADVGPNGALDWGPSGLSTVGNLQVGLGRGLQGASLISYNNKLYLAGGTTSLGPANAQDTVATAFLDDNLNPIAYDPGSPQEYFVGTGSADRVLDTDAGDEGRANLGAVVVKAEPPDGVINGSLNSAWAFVIGGENKSGTAKNSIYRGQIGGDEASDTRRAPNGWYYSSVIPTTFTFGSGSNAVVKDARLVAFHWAAEIDRSIATGNPNADIRLSFRSTLGANPNCPDESVFKATDTWSDVIDGDSNPFLNTSAAAAGALYNSVPIADIFGGKEINATCIQYRAEFVQDYTTLGPGPASNKSPKLLSVYVEKVVAGNVDLNIPDGGFAVQTVNNRLSSLKMNLRNLDLTDPNFTLSIPDYLKGNGLSQTGDGSFYVDLCIARTDLGQAAPTLTLPDPADQFGVTYQATCPYYATVYNSEMAAGITIDLTASTVPAAYGGGPRWRRNADDSTVSDIRSAFNQTGNYKIGLVLDSWSNIPEGTTGEANNKALLDAFTIEGPPLYVIMLPFTQR